MMGMLGRLLGSDKALTAIVGGVGNALDALVHTDQEKAEEAAHERKSARVAVVEWMRNSQGQNIARRLIALVITLTWLFMYLLSAALDVAVIWSEDPTNLVRSAESIGARAESMTGAMMLILAFYFAAPHMGSIVKVAMNKFSNERQKVLSDK